MDHNKKWVRDADFSKDGSWLVTGDFARPGAPDGIIRVWDVMHRSIIYDYPAFENGVPFERQFSTDVTGVTLHPTRNFVAVGSATGQIKIWDARRREATKTFQAHDNAKWKLFRLKFSPDGSYLVSSTGDWPTHYAPGEMKIWNCQHLQQEGDPEAKTIPLEASTNTLAFTPNGQSLVTDGAEGVALWDVRSGKTLRRLTDEPTVGVAVSRDGRLLATSTAHTIGRAILLWDLSSQQSSDPVGRLPNAGSEAMAFSPDNRTLAMVGWGHRISLWNVAARREVITLEGHRGFVQDLVFSPDGTILASASGDGTVRLWPSAPRSN